MRVQWKDCFGLKINGFWVMKKNAWISANMVFYDLACMGSLWWFKPVQIHLRSMLVTLVWLKRKIKYEFWKNMKSEMPCDGVSCVLDHQVWSNLTLYDCWEWMEWPFYSERACDKGLKILGFLKSLKIFDKFWGNIFRVLFIWMKKNI